MAELGGEEYEETTYRKGQVRADLCEIATKFSFQHGAKIIDAILSKYNVTRKK